MGTFFGKIPKHGYLFLGKIAPEQGYGSQAAGGTSPTNPNPPVKICRSIHNFWNANMDNNPDLDIRFTWKCTHKQFLVKVGQKYPVLQFSKKGPPFHKIFTCKMALFFMYYIYTCISTENYENSHFSLPNYTRKVCLR